MAEPSIPAPESLWKPLARRISINGVEYELDVEWIVREAQIQIDAGDHPDEEEFDAGLEQQRHAVTEPLDCAPTAQPHRDRARVEDVRAGRLCCICEA